MRIALDYDKTYTVDPGLWDEFILLAQDRGHDVFIATMRYPHEAIEGVEIPVIYTCRKAKRSVVTADVWIDDSPHWIFQDALQ